MRRKPQLLALSALAAWALLAMPSLADDNSTAELERAQAMLKEIAKNNARHRPSRR